MQRQKRLPWLVVAVILLLGAAGGSWYWVTRVRGFTTTDDAEIDGNSVIVSPRILGRVAVLAADEGDKVRVGDALVRLDDTDLKAQQALAASGVVSAERNAVLARVNLGRANADFERARQLYAQKNVSQETFEHAQSAAAAAEAQVAVANAQIDTARAQLSVIDAQLQNTVLSSPVNGVVAKRWVSVGEVVQPAQAVFTVNDLGSVWVSANFEETKLNRIAVGAIAQITVDAHPGLRLDGKVTSIGSSTASQFSLIPASNASGNFTKITQRIPVKISLERSGGDPPLLPGMSATVRVSSP
jgi:membrane fusion protein (multidrug efflux system)